MVINVYRGYKENTLKVIQEALDQADIPANLTAQRPALRSFRFSGS